MYRTHVGCLNVLAYLFGNRNAFPVGQNQNSIVVQRVAHILAPTIVNRSVKYQPFFARSIVCQYCKKQKELLTFFRVSGITMRITRVYPTYDRRHDSVRPLVRGAVVLAEQFVNGQCIWIKNMALNGFMLS